jgi:pimeloyl-ACP methyl ester carboxylesterase
MQKKVTSKDGTEIAFEKSGNGPALIIVGGSLADHQFYGPLADELAKHFMVYNFDRRGRGQSGNMGAYAVEREIEDVAALIDFAKESVCMYGHSAGSALALRAAAAGLNITKVALADPPFTPRGRNDEEAKTEFAEEAAHIKELHNKDDHRGSVKFFLGGMGLSDEDIERILESPAGETMIDSARALPYDYALLGDDGLVPTNLGAKVKVPTVIFAPKAMPETAQALADAMPNASFQGLEVSAHETPPADMAEKLTEFFLIQQLKEIEAMGFESKVFL